MAVKSRASSASPDWNFSRVFHLPCASFTSGSCPGRGFTCERKGGNQTHVPTVANWNLVGETGKILPKNSDPKFNPPPIYGNRIISQPASIGWFLEGQCLQIRIWPPFSRKTLREHPLKPMLNPFRNLTSKTPQRFVTKIKTKNNTRANRKILLSPNRKLQESKIFQSSKVTVVKSQYPNTNNIKKTWTKNLTSSYLSQGISFRPPFL